MTALIYLKVIFSISLILFLHSYIFYPLIIKLISFFKKDQKISSGSNNSVSILIAAYNEEKTIEERIKNLANSEYDFTKIEVIVGSDGSRDKTVEILNSLQNKFTWLKIYDYDKRRGKSAVLNDLVKVAKNDILIFTDANTVFEKDTIKQLASSFVKEDIGGVCGRLNLTNQKYKSSGSSDEVSYWRYEIFIKQAEGDCNILIGSNGGNYAIRKTLFESLPIEKPVTDDLFITLNVLSKNYKFIYNNEAVGYEEVSPGVLHEFRRKVRFAASNFQSLILLKKIMFSKNFLLSFAFWSHKILRWVMPFIFGTLFISNILILNYNVSSFYYYIFYLQLIWIFLSLVGLFLDLAKVRVPILSLFYFFALTNIALVFGFFRFLTGKHKAYWQSTPR